jgi:tetratricopeptide (TPR) repeat protein
MSKAQMRMLREEEDRQQMARMAALAAESESDDDADDEEQVAAPAAAVVAKKKKKKKKRKPKKKKQSDVVPVTPAAAAAAAPAVVAPSPAAAAPPPAPKAKAKSKAKKASEKPKKSARQLKDEQLDKLLAEFGVEAKQEAGGGKESVSGHASSPAKRHMLVVEAPLLDYRRDLKALFGVAVAKAMSKKMRAGGDKTWLSRCGETWPAPRAMLTVRELGREADDGATAYGFDWTPQYAAAEADFLDAVASNQPNFLAVVLQRYGYHSGALLQLATLSQKAGQFEQAADLLERSVYFFELCIGSSFRLDDPLVRVPHAHRENQALFVTLFKWASMLGRKGCCRAALECCKMVLSWDRSDPLDLLLMVDWLALRCEQYDFLIELMETGYGVKKLAFYPNLAYGVAFALLERKRMPEARAALLRALLLFPECALSILGTLGINCDFRRSSWFSQFGDTSSNVHLQRAISVYCSRSKDLWRARVLQEFVSSVAVELAGGGLSVESERVKHMMLSEEEFENAAPIPAALLQEALNLDALDRPPPPESEIALARLMGSAAAMPTLEQQIEQIRRAPTANALSLFFHSLLPWNDPNAPPDAELDEASLWERARALLGVPAENQERQGAARDSDDEASDDPRNNAAAEDSSTED